MTLPTVVKTWTISPNNRIPYVSVIGEMQGYLHGIKTFLKANGYTVKGSCSAGTGAMDATDRWTVTTDVTPRGTSASTSQAWIVLTAGNGVDILLAWQGAGTTPTGDDLAKISFSPGGLFVVAGTPSWQPTATDEQVVSTITQVGSTTSGDRVWHGWVDSTAYSCRFAIGHAGASINCWGVESVTPTVGTNVTFSPPVWGFFYTVAGAAYFDSLFSVNVDGGVARASIGGTAYNLTLGGTCESCGNTKLYDVVHQLNYDSWLVLPTGVYSNLTNATGKLGNLIDFWVGRGTGIVDGDVYGARQFIHVSGKMVWPWDGATDPTYT